MRKVRDVLLIPALLDLVEQDSDKVVRIRGVRLWEKLIACDKVKPDSTARRVELRLRTEENLFAKLDS